MRKSKKSRLDLINLALTLLNTVFLIKLFWACEVYFASTGELIKEVVYNLGK